jgi:predicted nucleic acid-binding protein
VKVLFDTSVLVSALVAEHPQHSVCFPWIEQARQQEIQAFISTHTLAEAYSVLTGTPNRSRISPALAQELLTDCLQYFEVVSISADDYQAAIAQMVALKLPGGGIFDALIAQAALKSSAEVLLTLNAKHFTRLEGAIATLIQVSQ